MSEVLTTTPIVCPNPRCSGSVSPDQPKCNTCGHELAACPNCGKLMSKTIGRCGWCGYRASMAREEAVQSTVTPPIPFTEAPIIVRFEASRLLVKESMAEAYRQVALADSDMASATRILEAIRTSLLTEPDAFKIWRQLDKAIGATEADAGALRLSLIALRTWFREELFAQQRTRLNKPFERDPEVGWCEWLRTYAEGLSRWRLLLCKNLVDTPFPFPEHFNNPFDFKSATQLILHERWTEVHQFFTFLSKQEFLHPYIRARLLISAGQIHLYYFRPPDRALEIFQQAEQLAPGLALVSAALGDYYANQNDFAQSRIYLERGIQAAPDEADAYCFMGDLAEKQGKLEETRKWYQEAINNAASESLGYVRLLRLYGRQEFIERYESQIAPLAEYAIAVDETNEYSTYLAVGDAYVASQRYETAYQWYNKATYLEPNRLGGYILKGFACLQDGESRYDTASEAFDTAIRIAPEAYNGYWGMGQLSERRGQWAEAAEWYALAMKCQPEYYSSFQSRVGEMQWKMGHLEKAEATLLDALRKDSTNDATVISLAEDYVTKHKPEEARRLLGQIRKIKGDVFEANYQNRVGNVYYYEKDYEKAAEYYRNAIQSDDKEAVYFANLSDAFRRLERWTDARDYLKKAYNLHKNREKHESQIARVYDEEVQALQKSLPTSADGLKRLDEAIAGIRAELEQAQRKEPFSDQLARLEQMRMFVVRYGTNALTFDPKGKPIRIQVASDLLPHILKEATSELSEDFLKLIEAMRKRLRERFGFPVPGLSFSELIGSDIPSGSYQIEVMDERVADWIVEAEERSDPQKYILKRIESALSGHLDKLCGHQETANLLEQCDANDCAQIKDDPRKLRVLTRRLKTILRQGESIANLALIAAEVNKRSMSDTSAGDQSQPKRATSEVSPGITKITLYVGKLGRPDRTELAEKIQNLQKQFFDQLGVIMPQVAIADSLNGFQIQINEERLPIELISPTPDQSLANELRDRADEMLTLYVVEHYLTKLKTFYPALVSVIRHYFSVEELTRLLRERLKKGSSIKNLPRVFEEFLNAENDAL